MTKQKFHIFLLLSPYCPLPHSLGLGIFHFQERFTSVNQVQKDSHQLISLGILHAQLLQSSSSSKRTSTSANQIWSSHRLSSFRYTKQGDSASSAKTKGKEICCKLRRQHTITIQLQQLSPFSATAASSLQQRGSLLPEAHH